MLAQNFKTANELRISEVEHAALIQVLGMMERGELIDEQDFEDDDPTAQRFDMTVVLNEDRGCGTSGCICGWAYVVSNKLAFAKFVNAYKNYGDTGAIIDAMPRPLVELFGLHHHAGGLAGRTQAKSAIALRSFLTSGEANWDDALAAV